MHDATGTAPYRDETQDDACYQDWVRQWDSPDGRDLERLRRGLSRLPRRPLFRILPLGTEARPDLSAALAAQIYPDWTLAPDAPAEYVIPLPQDALLPAHALAEIAMELACWPGTALLFTDEDRIDAAGRRHSPRFKGGWDPDLMLACDAVGCLAAYDRSMWEQEGGLPADPDAALACHHLALRVGAAAPPDRIRHLPAILCHRRAEPGAAADPARAERARAMVRAYLGGASGARVVPAPHAPHWNRIIHPLPDPAPLVSIIVPTRDRAGLLELCADGILNRTAYRPFELLIADNGSSESDALALLALLARDPRVRVLPCPGPFNWSAINNRVATAARGEILVLLNNDIDIADPDWLTELVAQASRPEVGAAGAKLLYPDGRVQHAGLMLGPPASAVHQYRFAERDAPGHLGQLVLAHGLSAVTGACLALRRAVFAEMGGLDERNLTVTFNDVDLCLRLRARGYRVIWTPHAALFHLEGVSRGSDAEGENLLRSNRELRFMRNAWGPLYDRDPFYNPNLTYGWDHVTLSAPPRRARPWQAGAGHAQETAA